MELDAVDQRLLDLLQQDASVSNLTLAEQAGISAATALRRVRQLRRAGIIERVMALVSPQAVAAGVNVLVEVTLDRQGAEHLQSFEAHVVSDPAVQQCYRVSPGPDFVLVLWAQDMGAYQAVADRLLTQQANVRNVKAYFCVKRSKFSPVIPMA